MLNGIKKKYRLFRSYYCNDSRNVNSRVKLHNWCVPAPQDFWIPRFLEIKGLLGRKTVSVFSVFGLRSMIRVDRSDVKIFVARENIHRPSWEDYDDLCLREDCVDLSVGYDYGVSDERYIRFPLWIMWLFSPNVTNNDVKEFCQRVNNPLNSSYEGRSFCSFISSHDDVGRKDLFDEIASIGKIDSAGRFMHNCDDLKKVYGDDKLRFLRQYRFNLCPENSNYEGYCTEKLFEAISSGCVPIYWGSDNNPEPDIINKDAVCFVKMGERNDEGTLNQIRGLELNRDEYENFARQNRLKQDAADVIMSYLASFEEKLNSIMKNS